MRKMQVRMFQKEEWRRHFCFRKKTVLHRWCFLSCLSYGFGTNPKWLELRRQSSQVYRGFPSSQVQVFLFRKMKTHLLSHYYSASRMKCLNWDFALARGEKIMLFFCFYCIPSFSWVPFIKSQDIPREKDWILGTLEFCCLVA